MNEEAKAALERISLRVAADVPSDRMRCDDDLATIRRALDRVERLEQVVRRIATQMTVQEVDAEHGEHGGDYEEGYDAIVRHARTTLAALDAAKNDQSIARRAG